MTKDTITLMHKLENDESLRNSEVFELYMKTIKIVDLQDMFKLLNELDEKVYDFAFLTQTSKDLDVKRSAVNELLSGMCEEVGKNIELYLQETPTVTQKYVNCPVKTDYVFLSAIPNKKYVQFELSRSNMNYLKLGEMRVDKTDWYNIYCFELLNE